MPLDASQLVQLRNEIDDNPQALDFGDLSNRAIAKALNEVGGSGETVDVEFVEPWEMQAAVVHAGFEALNAANQRAWLAIVGLSEIPVKNTGLRAQVQAIWPAGATRTALQNLQSRSASRAEALFGENVALSFEEIGAARNLWTARASSTTTLTALGVS
jgi:hypothetical protein